MPEEPIRELRTKYLHPLTRAAIKRVVEWAAPSVEDYDQRSARKAKWRKRKLDTRRLLLAGVISWVLSHLLSWVYWLIEKLS